MIKKILYTVLFSVMLNITVTVTVDRIKNPNITETELFKRIPHTFLYNFKL